MFWPIIQMSQVVIAVCQFILFSSILFCAFYLYLHLLVLLAIQKGAGAVVLFVLGWVGVWSIFFLTFTVHIHIQWQNHITHIYWLSWSSYKDAKSHRITLPIFIGYLGLLTKMQNLNSPKFSPTLINQLKCSCTFALDISLQVIHICLLYWWYIFKFLINLICLTLCNALGEACFSFLYFGLRYLKFL